MLCCVTVKSWVSPALSNTLYTLIVKKLKAAVKAEREDINMNGIDAGKEWLKLSLYLLKHHAIKAWGCVVVCILTSALN